MYCRHCGHKLPDGCGYCLHCGQATGAPAHNRRLSAKVLSDRPVILVGICVVLLITIIGLEGGPGHDLSGTYQTSEFFPVNEITFQTNGHFSAVSYIGYTESYTGAYSKKLGGGYSLRFTGGSASGGSPVTQYEASTVGKQYELAAEKADGNALKVRVIPKLGYYAWSGAEAYFYKR